MKVIDISDYKKIKPEKNDIDQEQEEPITELTQLSKIKSLESNDYIIDSDNQENSLYDFPSERDTPITTGSFFSSKSTKKNQKKKNKSNFGPTRKGNMIMFFYNKYGEPLICIGPHWPLTLCMMSVIDLIIFLYFYFLWTSLIWFIKYLGVLIAFSQFFSYWLIFLSNPGIPTKDLWIENYFKEKHEEDDAGSYRICNICKIIMKNEDNTDHCEECNICIIGCDHHCPWTSKCIGKNNKVTFYCFTISTFILILYFVFALFTLGLFTNPIQKDIKNIKL